MVLHKNKWDRKATRAHVRKQQAKGKDGKVGAAAHPAPAGEAPVEQAGPGDEEGEGEEGSEDEDEGEGKEGGGQFVKRKVASNAWRYEEEEELPGAEVEEPPPEPDYVKLTIGRRGELEDPEIVAALSEGVVDEGFLSESLTQGKRHGEGARGKGRRMVFKVDRSQFEDVTEKISKQSAVDAFRQRFAPRKEKPGRVGGQIGIGVAAAAAVRGEDEETEGAEDVDSFLEELNLDDSHHHHHPSPVVAPRSQINSGSGGAGSRGIGGGAGLGRSSLTSSGGGLTDKDDDWLDSMLGKT